MQAHCTRAIGNAQIYVMIGDHNTAQSTGQRITVESVIDHPNYNSRTYDNGTCKKILITHFLNW